MVKGGGGGGGFGLNKSFIGGGGWPLVEGVGVSRDLDLCRKHMRFGDGVASSENT